jgi:hypothetical protein
MLEYHEVRGTSSVVSLNDLASAIGNSSCTPAGGRTDFVVCFGGIAFMPDLWLTTVLGTGYRVARQT